MEDINIRSEEVQEVLGTPPGWIVRYGSALALIFMVLFIIVAAKYKYPDTVVAPITVTFSEPPRNLVAPKSGRVEELLVRNNTFVREGQLLVVFKDAANYNHVTHLQDLLDQIPNENDSLILAFSPNTNLELGELQEDFLEFLEKKNRYNRESEQYEVNTSVNSYSSQIRSLQKSIQLLENRKAVIVRQINDAIKRQNFLEQQVANREASQQDVNKVIAELRDLRNELQETDENITGKRNDIELLRKRISVTKLDGNNTRLNASDELLSSFIQLKIRVNQWVENNAVYSPIEGKVEFNELLSDQQFMQKDDPLMVIIPSSSQILEGRMKVDLANSGFIEPRQEVIIRLKKYPFETYGALRGIVTYKASVPDEFNRVLVEIQLPELKTTRGKKIEANEVLVGNARIITKERTLLLRIFDSIRGIFS